MFDICHPTYYHMSQLGCNDQVELSTAFYVYMELCEVKRYWDVSYKYSEALELYYLEARKSKNAKLDIFIPWPAFNNLTLNLISNIQHELQTDKFTFVFKDSDTTSVYYSISAGMIKPIAPENTTVLKQKEKKKFALEKEINRNTANLYERALSLNDGENKIEKSGESEMDIFLTAKSCFEPENIDSIKNNDDSVPADDQESAFVDSRDSETLNSENNSESKSEFIVHEKLSEDPE